MFNRSVIPVHSLYGDRNSTRLDISTYVSIMVCAVVIQVGNLVM